jgi:hypothetical protein
MSHSKIYQISSKPIAEDEYASPSDFYENSGDFADYIGDEMKGDERRECIESLADTVKDLFVLDETGEALVFKGADALRTFCERWASAIREAAGKVTADTVLQHTPRYTVKAMCDETYLDTAKRFAIKDWCEYASPADELIEYVAGMKMRKGRKLYIGAVIDYHY